MAQAGVTRREEIFELKDGPFGPIQKTEEIDWDIIVKNLGTGDLPYKAHDR